MRWMSFATRTRAHNADHLREEGRLIEGERGVE